MTAIRPALIGIDWGTSRLRALQIDATGQVLERRESDRGIIATGDGEFENVLGSTIDGWPSDLPILMCGMIGSRQGWLEMPYCPCPARAVDLGRAVGTIRTDRGLIRILGGVSTTDERGVRDSRSGTQHYDVMRGEETQIFGVEPASGSLLVVTPGTHSKWAIVEDAAIRNFRTYMTGELYAILRERSILGRLMDHQQRESIDESCFMDGVYTAFDDQDLLHTLFNVRTQALFKKKPPEMLPSYLSGILIGSEVCGGVRQRTADCAVIISSPELGSLYQLAMSAAGLSNIRRVDGADAVARGLWRLWQLRGAE
jgi:2-dehydro-3-deoxygalactonokinase